MRILSKEQLAAPVVRGVKEVILELTGLELTEHTEHPADSSAVGKELTVLVGIVGALEGQISYSISKDFACKFASTLLGETMTVYDEMSESAICELGNMVTGRATVLLQEDGFICDLCPPTILMAQNVKISSSNIEPHIVHMSGKWGVMEVHIALTPAPGKQRAKKEEHPAPTVTGIITADILLADIQTLFFKGEYNKAIESARTITALNFACSSKLSGLCQDEGIRLYKENNIQNALQVLEIAAEFDAFSFETCLHLGHCYAAQENWPLALHNYRSAAGIETGNSDCFFHVGYCLYNIGSREKAIRALQVAVDMGHKKAKELMNTINGNSSKNTESLN